MLRTTLRTIAGHKLRMLTTGLAVALGVAFLAGTLVLSDTLTKTFDDLFADVYENTDAVVRQKAAFEDPNGFGDQRGRVDATLIERVEGVDGVAAADGNVFGFAQIVDKDGTPLGGNWPEVDEINAFNLVAGRAPRGDDEVVIDKASADDAGYRVGDTATVLVKGPPLRVNVVGIARFGTADSPGGASFTLFSTPVAQRLVGEPSKFDEIAVVADDGVSQSQLRDRLARVVPRGTEAVTGDFITKENQDNFQQGLSVFSTFMLIFALVALFVGGFMIFNTFFITVAQRTRENALMRAVGASKRQILASILLEAAAVGVIASFVGVAAGVAVAAGLKSLLATFGMDLPDTGIVFTSTT